MTFKELKQKIGPQEKSDWAKHKNGGGWVNKNATVDESAYVGEGAIIYNAWVSGKARVSGNAWVYGNAMVSGDARVSGSAWEKSPLFIIGSKHSLTNSKHGHIQIGCHCKTFEYWKENYKRIGEIEGYTKEEIKEYGEYIKLFKKIGK